MNESEMIKIMVSLVSAAVVAVPLVISSPAQSQDSGIDQQNVEYFLNKCDPARPNMNAADVGFCLGYFSGVIQTYDLLGRLVAVDGPELKFMNVCLPPGLTLGQLMGDLLTRFTRFEGSNISASYVSGRYLEENWPCEASR